MYETTSSEEDSDDDGEEGAGGKTTAGLVDVEDIGKVVHKMKKVKKQRDADKRNGELREMVTPMLRKALTKQGMCVCMRVCIYMCVCVCVCMHACMRVSCLNSVIPEAQVTTGLRFFLHSIVCVSVCLYVCT